MSHSPDHTSRDKPTLKERLWDLWCIASVVGIWPRFIEPNWIWTKQLKLPIRNLPVGLSHLRLVHFSDLHFYPRLSERFLKRFLKKIAALKPDLIVFTGDFICYSNLEGTDRLQQFLKAVTELAPLGVWSVLGNHDYSQFASIDDTGTYSVVKKKPETIARALRRLWKPPEVPCSFAELNLHPHPELVEIIRASGWKLLHNRTEQLSLPQGELNLTGFGEYMMGDIHLKEAFAGYNHDTAGLLLLHNPDAIPMLSQQPGELILCGHTHGGQVNLPWIGKRFSLMQHPQYKKGLVPFEDKAVYITRGVGSVLPFRWFAPPELVAIELIKA